jgi:hypothetical protein
MIASIKLQMRDLGAMIFVIAATMFVCACSNTPSYESVEDLQFKKSLGGFMKRVDSKLKEGERVFFRLDTLTKFKWDKMYSIPGNVLKKDIEKRIGVPWDFNGGLGLITDDDLLLIFMKGKRIVSTVKIRADDPTFKQFSMGVVDVFTPVTSPIYFIYKQFDSSGYYNLIATPVALKLEQPAQGWLDKLQPISLD